MTLKWFGAVPGVLSVALASLVARAQPSPESGEASAPAGDSNPVETPSTEAAKTEPSKTEASETKASKTEPAKTQASSAPQALNVELYGALLPFFEYVSNDGATPLGLTVGASQVTPDTYTGFNAPPRFRMTAGTSNLGFRGTFALLEQLKLTWQVESAVPIDGNGPNTFASRNSHIGFTGDWGTLIFGIWDTPWKWATLVTINPIKGSFVPDYNAILNTPGFGVGAANTVSILQGTASNAAFYRRESNSIQYWSPTVAGFSLRLNYTINEERPSPADSVGPVTNPYLVSGYVGFDGGGLRIRYAYEMHHDYFGMSQLGGARPSEVVTSSTDMGHQATVQYTLTVEPEVRTRLVGTGELLSYESTDSTPDDINKYSRPAFYALLEQTLFGHHLWLAYGQAFEGRCTRVGGGACSTAGLGAKLGSVGYLYAFNENTSVYLAGYRVVNDAWSRHTPYPPLNTSAPGADVAGAGLGIFYSFGLKAGH